jgi:isopentenyl-diphosphate delta-isomerase
VLILLIRDESRAYEVSKEILVLVDEEDNQVGTADREEAHLGMGKRHRAFVVFLFKDNKLIIQRRSMKKKLWPGYWDVSYTSHVYPEETYTNAARRKALQELGIEVNDFKEVLSFVYWAPYNGYSENEFCKLFVAYTENEPKPNPEEVMDVRYLTLEEVEKEVLEKPEAFTPWFKISLSKYREKGN